MPLHHRWRFWLRTHVYATLTLAEKERRARARSAAAALVAFHNQMPSNSSSSGSIGKCSCSSAVTERKATAQQHSARVGTCFSNGCNTSRDHCELVLSAPSSDRGDVWQQQQLLRGSKKEGGASMCCCLSLCLSLLISVVVPCCRFPLFHLLCITEHKRIRIANQMQI